MNEPNNSVDSKSNAETEATAETVETTEPTNANSQAIRTHVLLVYGFMLFGILFSGGVLSIAGVIWAYLKRSDAEGTVFASHFTNVIRTFWICFVLGIVAIATLFVGIGWVVALVAGVYALYKYIKGLVKAIDGKPYPMS